MQKSVDSCYKSMTKSSSTTISIKKTSTLVRYIFRISAHIITALATLVYLLSAYSPYVPPFVSSTIALLGLVFPIALGVQSLILAYWLLKRRWFMVLGLVIVFIMSWGSIRTYIPIRRSPQEALERYEGEKLKVLSYNVCGFGFSHHNPQKPNRVLLYLKSSNADIICLQEASLSNSKDWGVTIEQIREYLGEQYPYIRFVASQPHGSMLMMLSKYPIKSAKRIEMDSDTNGAVHYIVNIRGQETHVLNLHLESFRLRASQGKEYMKLVARGEALKLEEALGTQLSPILRKHNLQANQIHAYIQSLNSERIIVCGDFNDTPISYARRKIAEGLSDAFVESGNGFGFSYASRTFIVRIDHILLGKAFEALYTKVDTGIRGSDHYPIFSYFKQVH